MLEQLIQFMASAAILLVGGLMLVALAASFVAGLIDRKTWQVWKRSPLRPRKSDASEVVKFTLWLSALPVIAMGRGLAVIATRFRDHHQKKKTTTG